MVPVGSTKPQTESAAIPPVVQGWKRQGKAVSANCLKLYRFFGNTVRELLELRGQMLHFSFGSIQLLIPKVGPAFPLISTLDDVIHSHLESLRLDL